MLENALFLLFVNPAFPDSGKMYDSGLREVENSYESDRPATDSPMLNIEFLCQDVFYNIVRPGFYEADLSPNFKFIYLLQSRKIIAKLPVIQVIEMDSTVSVPEIKVGFVKNNVVFILLKREKLEIMGILYKTEEY